MKLYAVAEVSYDNKEIFGYYNWRDINSPTRIVAILFVNKLTSDCLFNTMKNANHACNDLWKKFSPDRYFVVMEFELSEPTRLLW